MHMQADLIFNAQAELGEGALWHEGRLWWVDIEGCTVNRFDPSTGRNRAWHLGQRVGTVVPRQQGGMVAAVHRGIGILDIVSGDFSIFTDPEGGRDELRFNDGKCDPRGRFFAGTMGLTKPRAAGSLFRVEADRTVTRVLTGTGTSNGLAWSRDDRTMYYIDTPTLEVSAFDYDPDTGAMTNRRAVVRFDAADGRPDGMTIDTAGNLWVALYDGSGVVCCDPRTGRTLERINTSASKTTSCAFGGPDLRDLYITSAQAADEPESGGLFVCRPGVQGVPAFSFAG